MRTIILISAHIIATSIHPDYLDDIKVTSIVLAALIAVVGDTIDMFYKSNKREKK
jgi:hypothetical protein|nr:MAG TPA: protein of unknown function (DUF4112) [Caudoviricetes sp.]